MKQPKHVIALLIASLSFTVTIAQHPEPQLVKDIMPGSESGMRGYQAAVSNNKLFFSAYTDDNKIEPWISDGTEAGTSLLKNIGYVGSPFPFEIDSEPANFTTFGSKVLFVATYHTTGVNDREPFISDGTAAGTIMLKNINTTFFDAESNAGGFCEIGDKVIFTADDGIHGQELWVTDGTSSGTFMLKDIYPGISSSSISPFYLIGTKAYFAANESGERSLWVTDGTVAGTSLVKSNILCQELTVFEGKIFMPASPSSFGENWELWVTDGTTEGTTIFKDLNPGTSSAFPSNLTVSGGKLYFTATDGTHGKELWSSDGTVAGTQMIKDIYPGSESSEAWSMLSYDGKLFFSAKNTTDNFELWVTDGTDEGTQIYAELTPGNEGSNPGSFKEYNGRLYFVANAANSGYHYWCIEGVGNPPFKIIPADADDTEFGAIFEGHYHYEMNGSLYYPAMYKTSIGGELYKITTTPFAPTSVKNPTSTTSIILYPNPFQNEILVATNVPINTVNIVDISGKTVWQKTHSNIKKDLTINTSNWMNGIYFARITTSGNAVITQTIVKY